MRIRAQNRRKKSQHSPNPRELAKWGNMTDNLVPYANFRTHVICSIYWGWHSWYCAINNSINENYEPLENKNIPKKNAKKKVQQIIFILELCILFSILLYIFLSCRMIIISFIIRKTTYFWKWWINALLHSNDNAILSWSLALFFLVAWTVRILTKTIKKNNLLIHY